MKNVFAIVLLGLVALAFAGMASADNTVVVGTIYDSQNHDIVYSGANVTVYCGDAVPVKTLSGDGTTIEEGTYIAKFNTDGCKLNSTVYATATYGALNGQSRNVSVEDLLAGSGLSFGIADADVFLVPEFGLVMGGLTIAGALIAFFVIRRK